VSERDEKVDGSKLISEIELGFVLDYDCTEKEYYPIIAISCFFFELVSGPIVPRSRGKMQDG
jgi:hypothetical protein